MDVISSSYNLDEQNEISDTSNIQRRSRRRIQGIVDEEQEAILPLTSDASSLAASGKVVMDDHHPSITSVSVVSSSTIP